MSLLVTNCHGYSATGITGWPASPTKLWVLAWIKVDATTSGAYRAPVQFSSATLNGVQDYFGIALGGGSVLQAVSRTGNENHASPDPGNFYLWNGENQNKWTVGCSIIDTTQSAADLTCIFGRAAATSKAATTQTSAADVPAFADQLVNIYVGGNSGKVEAGTGTTNDSTDGIKIAYVAMGHGSVPSQADMQLVIDGMHPADLAGVWEYWDLTSSSAGLTGALQGITLAPYGGSATTTWDGADNPTVDAPSGGDTTAPTLTSASVTSVGATTATGNVTTDEGNGTLYSIVSASATAPSAAQIQAGQNHTGAAAVWSGNQAVSSTGAKNFSITGLTASTSYYAHFQHKDSANNNSSVVTSAQFTTGSADTTNPTMTGSVTISAKTTTSYTASWPAGSDNVAVTGYEYRLNAGSWVDLGSVLTVNISARTPGATDAFEVRAYDAAANKSSALSHSVTLYIGTITLTDVTQWETNVARPSNTGVTVDISNISTGALVVRKTGQVTTAGSDMAVKDAAIADATLYQVVLRFSDGSVGVEDITSSLT